MGNEWEEIKNEKNSMTTTVHSLKSFQATMQWQGIWADQADTLN